VKEIRNCIATWMVSLDLRHVELEVPMGHEAKCSTIVWNRSLELEKYSRSEDLNLRVIYLAAMVETKL
jgi:hypothetical protein